MTLSKCFRCGGSFDIRISTKKNSYLYKECGLDNVELHGIKVYSCKKCDEEYAEIPEIKELHKVIALCLCLKEERLLGAEIRFIRKEMKMKSVEFARLLSITPAHVSRLQNDSKEISASLGKLVRSFYIIYASEDLSKAVCKGTVSRFADLPRKASKQNQEEHFYLSKKDWLSGGSQLCEAFC